MKIVIIQNKGFLNGSGGTEKICSFLANKLSDFHEIEIVTNDNIINGLPVFSLKKEIGITNIYNRNNNIINLHEYYNYKGQNLFLWISNKIKKKYQKFQNKRILKKIGGIKNLYSHNLNERSILWKSFFLDCNADIIITMSINSLLEITHSNELKIPIINSVNGRPDYDYSDLLWYRSELEQNLLTNAYKHLSGIQILFESYKYFLPDSFKGISSVIPNPIHQVNNDELINHSNTKERYKIINIASLVTSCKQQDIAIKIFSNLAHKYPNWDLYFWGEGNDKEDLEILIRELNLENRVFLCGFTSNPIEELKKSDLFIFPSKYEGFPLALAEAMSVGLPVIGFSTCSGVNELIIHNQSGFLCHSDENMQNNLEKLILDSELRKKFGLAGHNQMLAYTENSVIEKWKSLIDTVYNKK